MTSSTFSVSVVGRGTKPRGRNIEKKRPPRDKPQSVVAHLNYITAQSKYDERLGQQFDYTRKQDVLYHETLAPKDAPTWASDDGIFWNKVEAFETRKDARLARSIIAGLQRELTFEQNVALVREFAEKHLVSKGMVVTFAIHESESSDGGKNPHVHLMLSVRKVTNDGFVTVKGAEWSDRKLIPEWRDAWEKLTNEALAKAGRQERISLKSYEKQGVDKTPQIHLGYSSDNKEKQGIITERGEHNRRVRHDNNVKEAIDGLVSDNRRKGKSVKKPKSQRLRSLKSVAKEQNETDDSTPRTKAQDERGAWVKFKRNVMANVRDDVRALDKRAMKAMTNSRNQANRRRELQAANARYSLHKSSKELSEELKDRDHER